MANIILHCYYSGEEEAVCGFIEEMLDSGLRGEVLAEDGCMQYDYFFSAEKRTSAVLLERWRDETSLSRHMNGAVMTKIKEVKQRYDVETRVERNVLKD
ncbi:MAG: antibiotic biosynthesis monooxygenase [Oscillospiraceae bacterium]|nr:antibiotic biosynthesis monooxygenase [Oscillospiraceae bacterium]